MVLRASEVSSTGTGSPGVDEGASAGGGPNGLAPSGLDAAALKRTVRYRRIIGSGEAETRCDHILVTLFNHQTHHRGQVHAALTQSGIEPPPLDVIFFLDEHPEVARL